MHSAWTDSDGPSSRAVFALHVRRPIKEINVKTLRRQMGVVSQEPRLFSATVSFSAIKPG